VKWIKLAINVAILAGIILLSVDVIPPADDKMLTQLYLLLLAMQLTYGGGR
jgi:hypothetical protein